LTPGPCGWAPGNTNATAIRNGSKRKTCPKKDG
jgi:hypothetical protein